MTLRIQVPMSPAEHAYWSRCTRVFAMLAGVLLVGVFFAAGWLFLALISAGVALGCHRKARRFDPAAFATSQQALAWMRAQVERNRAAEADGETG